MEALDYEKLAAEIEKKLRKKKEIVLSTCAGDHVTARTMCHINDGLQVLFSTDRRSLKAMQMQENPRIALTVDDLTIEATAELFGRPKGHALFIREYPKKFPHLGKAYPETPDDLLIIAHPKKIQLFRYIGKPAWDVLEPETSKAYRI